MLNRSSLEIQLIHEIWNGYMELLDLKNVGFKIFEFFQDFVTYLKWQMFDLHVWSKFHASS